MYKRLVKRTRTNVGYSNRPPWCHMATVYLVVLLHLALPLNVHGLDVKKDHTPMNYYVWVSQTSIHQPADCDTARRTNLVTEGRRMCPNLPGCSDCPPENCQQPCNAYVEEFYSLQPFRRERFHLDVNDTLCRIFHRIFFYPVVTCLCQISVYESPIFVLPVRSNQISNDCYFRTNCTEAEFRGGVDASLTDYCNQLSTSSIDAHVDRRSLESQQLLYCEGCNETKDTIIDCQDLCGKRYSKCAGFRILGKCVRYSFAYFHRVQVPQPPDYSKAHLHYTVQEGQHCLCYTGMHKEIYVQVDPIVNVEL